MYYDYKNAKKRIIDTISSKTDIDRESKYIPKNESEFTFKNGIKTWVGALFVDIVDSSRLFKEEKDERIARIIRSFCDEIIRILSLNDNYRQIGIRGDCIFAIYDAPKIIDTESILLDASYINTFQNMFQKILQDNQFPTFEIGTGLGLSETLVIKAGQKGSGINDYIWIGSSVVNASKLSSEAARNSNPPILLDNLFKLNLEEYCKKNNAYSWFNKIYSRKLNEYIYGANIIKIDFDEWITNEFVRSSNLSFLFN